MVKPIEVMGVYEEGLELIVEMSDHRKEHVEKFLEFLREGVLNKTLIQQAIPEDAPVKLKSETATSRGKFYRAVSRCHNCEEDNSIIGFEWYEANDRSVLYVWRMGYMELA